MKRAPLNLCRKLPVCVAGCALALVLSAAPAAADAPDAATARKVSFKFVEEDAAEVLSALSQFYGVPFRTAAPIEQPISLDSRGQMDLAGAIDLLSAALAGQGFAVRLEGGVVKIAPESVLLAVDIEVIVLKHSDPTEVAKVVTELFRTRDVLMDMVAKDPELVERLLPRLGRAGWAAPESLRVEATPWPPLKAVIVKAPKRMMPLIREFIVTQIDEAEGEVRAAAARAAAEQRRREAEAAKRRAEEEARRKAEEKPPPPERTRTFQPVFVKAEYIAEYCRRLKGVRPEILPHNVLMHKTRKYEEFDAIEEVMEMLDVPDSTSVQQYYIQLHHADAERVRRLLVSLYSFTLQEPVTREGAERLAAERPLAPPTLEADIDVLPELTDEDLVALQIPVGDVTIVADTENNALIVRTIPANIKAIRELIERIDRPRGQVVIDVFIAEVALDDTLELGMDLLYTGTISRVAGSEGTYAVGQDFGVIDKARGLTYSMIADNIDLFIRALQTRSRLDVISRPSVTTLDNTPAVFEFGRQVPLIQASNINVQGEVISSVVRYQSVSNKLVVTPHINTAGFISLSIEQFIDDVSEERFTISEQLEPQILIKRYVKTNLRVYNGQTVWLGGFINDRIDNTESRVPILADIPLLGELFKSSRRRREKTELLVFITPHIIETPEELLAQTHNRQAKSLVRQDSDRHLPRAAPLPEEASRPPTTKTDAEPHPPPPPPDETPSTDQQQADLQTE